MLYERIMKPGEYEYKGYLYMPDEYQKFHEDTFSPMTLFEGVLFEIKDGSYNDKKEQVRDIAQRFQSILEPGLSWEEIAIIQTWFERNGKRYGLIKEFRENGII